MAQSNNGRRGYARGRVLSQTPVAARLDASTFGVKHGPDFAIEGRARRNAFRGR